MSWEDFLTPEWVRDINLRAGREHGGGGDSERPGCVESSIGATRQAWSYEGSGEEMNPLFVAAYLMCYLAQNHCFGNANKRTAWRAAAEVLRRVELRIDASEDEALAMLHKIVEERLRGRNVLEWLEVRVVEGPMDPGNDIYSDNDPTTHHDP